MLRLVLKNRPPVGHRVGHRVGHGLGHGLGQVLSTPGLRSQSPAFSGLVFKTSRFACDRGWKVCLKTFVTFRERICVSACDSSVF